MEKSADAPRIDLSFVIPVLDEQPSLATLTNAIKQVLHQEKLVGEIIFIDDGSHDGSWQEIARLSTEHVEVQGIRFRRNFGKAAALAAGFKAATGTYVFTMDADLQDDPEEIPRFLQKLDEGLDVISGWKQIRHDPWHKRWPSLVFNGLVGVMTGVKIHDHNCGFKVYRREVVAELNLYGEMHRFVPVLAAARGWRVGEISVRHHARKFGQSKYGMKRLVKGFLDLATVYFLTGYARRPLHFLGTVGLTAFLFGFIALAILTAGWVLTRIIPEATPLNLHERAIFYYAITSILLGTQLLAAGLLAEMFAAASSRTTIPYSVSETTEVDGNDSRSARALD